MSPASEEQAMLPEDVTELESVTLPSREKFREAYEYNQQTSVDHARICLDGNTGRQEAMILYNPNNPLVPYAIEFSRFVRDGWRDWPTRHDARSAVFENHPEYDYEDEDEVVHTDEFEAVVDEEWEKQKEEWWSENRILDEIEFENGHTVEVRFKEDEEETGE